MSQAGFIRWCDERRWERDAERKDAVDWYISLPYATGLVTVQGSRVVKTPPILRWMLGMYWWDAKATIIAKGGSGEPVP